MREPDDREADLFLLNEPVVTEGRSSLRQASPRDRADEHLLDDHQLLRQYFGGDEQAFEVLVEKYFRMVYAVAARQTGDSHLAEEIAQSVFLILLRKGRGFTARISMPGWLLRTTRFVSWDAVKTRRRREENERKLAEDLEHQPGVGGDSNRMEVLLDEALQTLRPDEQAGIVARYFEGKDFQEIAEMFAISQDAARKRTSRCLAKLQAFMEKRGAKVAAPTLLGLLGSQWSRAAADLALQSAGRAIQPLAKGKVTGAGAVGLAQRATLLLRWRSVADLSAAAGLALLVALAGIWAVWGWARPAAGRVDRLGRAWGALDQRIAQHRQFLIQTPPTAPNYQARAMEDLGAIGRESGRLIGELKPLLVAPNDRTLLAQFFVSELSATLKLDPSAQATLLGYLQGRLAHGVTLNDAMKALAEGAPSEAAEIRATLTDAQRQAFDAVYGADGTLLFSYAKAVALGTIGP